METRIQRLEIAAMLPRMFRSLLLLLLVMWSSGISDLNCFAGDGTGRHSLDNPAFIRTAVRMDDPVPAATDDVAAQSADRFLAVLRQQPRAGVAFDRVYRFHLERNSLDALIELLSREAQMSADNADAWILLGLFKLRRQDGAGAIEAFQTAHQLRPQDAFASWYLGRALTQASQLQAGVRAMETAIAAGPEKRSLLEISRELSRLYQRLKQPDRALQLWKSIESQYAQDLRVREQIADAMASSGQFDAALARYQQLAEQTQDRYRSVQYQLQAVEMKLRMNRQQEALQDLEQQLRQLRPDSWLYQEVRARIEDVFLRVNNRSALVAYYRNWLKDHPDDLETRFRLAQALAAQGDGSQAVAMYQQALQQAPSDIRIRKALISALVRARDFSEAMNQHQKLFRLAPDDLDNLQAWGLLYLRDRTLPTVEQRRQAAAVWKQMTQSFPESAAVAGRVGELLRRTGQADEAIAMYRRAVSLAPAELQYRETLGTSLYEQGRRDEAVQEWRRMAEGEFQNVATLIRLAEILLRFEQSEPAFQSLQDALALMPDFFDQLKIAKLLSDLQQDDQALRLLQAAAELSESSDEQQRVEDIEIEVLKRSGRLAAAVTALHEELQAGKLTTAVRWQRLARMQQAMGHPAAAMVSTNQALELSPQSVALHTSAAQLLEELSQLDAAIQHHQTLVSLDPVHQAQHLKQIIRIQQQLGDQLPAVQTAQQLLNLEPDQLEHYLLIADLYGHVNRPEEALKTVQRARELFPTDHAALMALAGILTDQSQIEQAIEVCWQAFESADSLNQQSGITEQLAELHLRTNRFEQLIERLHGISEQPDQQRSMAFCIAAAYLVADRTDLARETLKPLLTDDTQDVELLQQLSMLYEKDGLPVDAAGYQRRINQISPSAGGRRRLAGLLLRAGSDYERAAQWAQACEVYLQALRDDPSRFAANFETHLQSFEYAKRLPELARMVLIVGVDQFGPETTQLIHLGAKAAQQDADDQPGAALIEAVLDNVPEQQLANLILAKRLMAIGDPEFLDRLIRILCDNAGGFGFERWSPWNAEVAVRELPRVLNLDNHFSAVQDNVDAQLKKFPGWNGGQLLASLLLAMQNQPDECERRLNALLSDPDLIIPDDVALTAVELLDRCEGIWHSQQIQLLKACLRQRSRSWSTRSLDDPVIYRLRNLYLSSGMPEKAQSLGREPDQD